MGVQTVKFKGEFDVSQIMNSIKQMRAELAKQGNSSLFGNLDKEISKLEGLGSTIQAQIGKGFASTKEFKVFEANVSKLELEFQKLGQSFDAVNGDNLKNALKGLDKQVDSMRKKANEMAAAFKTSFSTETAGMGEKAKALTKDIAEMAKSGKDFAEAQNKITQSYETQIQKAKELALLRKQDLEKAQNAVAEVGKSGFQKRQFTTKEGGAIDATQLAKINQIYQDVIRNASNGQKAQSAFNAALEQAGIIAKNKSVVDSRVTNGYRAYTAEVKANAKALNDANSAYEKAEAKEQELIKEQQQVSAALQRQKTEYEQAAEAGRKYSAAEDVVNKKKEQQKNTTNALSASINVLRNSLANEAATLRQNATATGESVKATDNFNSSLDNLKMRAAYILSIGNAFYQIKRAITDTLNDIKSIDKAFASIAMVTDKTISGLWQRYGEYASMAQKLGQSTESAIKASALFYQQGLKDAEVMYLTEETMKLATLAGLDFEQATSQMTAALRGFHMEMDKGAHVTDVYSELAAHAAADVNGIAYAMSKTASIANNAGMSFENTAAFLTQMIETTQEAPENIGTAMKTIIARFTELKKNIAGTAESEFDDLEYNKVDKALKSVGVSLKDTTGQFRNLDDVFLELSKKWNTLDRNSQRYIATIAAGSRQQSRFIAMMENYDRTLQLVNITEDAQGRSQQQFEKNAESLSFKIQALKTSWEQLRISFLDSGFLKEVVDRVTHLVDAFGKMDGKQIATLGVMGVTIGRAVISKFIESIKQSTTDVMNAGKLLKDSFIKGWNTGKTAKNNAKGLFGDFGITQVRAVQKELQGVVGETQKISMYDAKLLLNYQNIDKAIDQIKLDMEALPQTEAERTEEEQAILNKYKEELEQLERQKKTIEQINAARNNIPLGTHVNTNTDPRSQNGTWATFKTGIKGAAGSALSMGLTTAIMTAVGGADLSTVIESALTTALIAALPGVISSLTTALSTKLAPIIAEVVGAIAAIPTAALAAVAAVIAGIALIAYAAYKAQKAQQAVEKAELDRLSNIEQKQKEINQSYIAHSQELNTAQKNLDNFTDSIERYQKLSAKTFLNTKEKEEMASLYDTITQEHPEIVDFQDENTKALTLNTDAIENLTLAYQDDVKKARTALKIDNVNKASAAIFKYKATNKAVDKYLDYISPSVFDDTVEKDRKALSQYNSGGNGTQKASNEPEWRRIRDSLQAIDERIIQGIGEDFTLSDMESIEKFNKYLDEAGLTVDEFGEKLKTQAEKFNTLDDVVKEVRQAMKNEYKNLDIEGLEISDRLADMLTSTLTKENVLDINDIDMNEKTKHGGLVKTKKRALRDYREGNFSELMDDEYADAYKRFLNEKGIHAYDFFSAGDPGSSAWNSNLAKFASLPQDFRDFLTEKNIDSDAWDDIRKNAEQSQKILYEYTKNRIAAYTNMLQEVSTEDLEKYKNELNELQDIYANSGDKTFSEYTSEIEQVSSKFNDDIKNRVNAYEQQEGSISKQFEKNIEDLKNLGMSDNFAENLILAVQNSILNMIADLNLTTEKSSAMAKALESALAPLTTEAQKVLLGIDLKEAYGTVVAQSDDYVKALMATGMTLEDATRAFKNYVDSAYNVIMRLGMGSEGADRFTAILRQNLGGFAETNEKLLAAQKEYFEKGTISAKTYYTLLEEGFEDYVTTTGKGFELLGNKTENYFTKQAMKPLNDLRDEIEHQQKMIDQFDSLGVKSARGVKDFQTDFEQGGVVGDLATKYGGKLENGTYVFDDKALIKMLKESPEDFEKAKKELVLLSDAEIEAITIAAENGADSLSDFTTKIHSYSTSLKSSEPEIYISSLVNLTEAFEQAEDKVKELKDKVDDLTKSMDENKKAWDDAEEALYKAIHGSELYKSSLDGLINYNNELKTTANLIEDLKNGLEDVSSAEESADIFNNLSQAYDTKIGNLYAQNAVIDNALENLRQTMLSKYGDFVSFNGDNAFIDFSYQQLDGNDELKKALEEEFKLYNDYLQKKRDNSKEVREVNKEREKYEKEYLKKFTDVQNDVVNILKEAAEEELKVTQDKYDALKEADDEYIDALQDAISKQRELRDRENSEEELAQKEKKLSLMQRDTSGSNAKEVQKLENDIEKDRQKLLDDSIDTIINGMKEVYEKQAEARDAEIDYMESVTENAQYFNDWAKSIMDSWNSVDDMTSWFLSNNPEVEDMTVESTELYIKDLEDKWKDLVTYQGLSMADLKSNSEIINQEMTSLYNNTSENISNIGTVTQTIAEDTAQKAIDSATNARDKAKEAYDESVKKLQEAQTELRTAEQTALDEHKQVMKEMVEASKSGIKDVSIYAVSQLAELKGVDLTDKEQAEKFAVENNWKNSEGQYSESFRQAVKNAGGDISEYASTMKYKVMAVEADRFGAVPGTVGGIYETKAEAEEVIQKDSASHPNYKYWIVDAPEGLEYGDIKKTKAYKNGGLVDYTGVAQVHGTPSRPEGFLKAEDTQNIMTAAELFAMSPLLNSSSAQNAVSSSVGDTSIEININVESISDDYDVDRLIKRVEDDINETARPVGTQVILNKRV